jgi:hypothetical protein
MSGQTVLDKAHDTLDKLAEFIVLQCLLVILVKGHPQKEAILEAFRDMTAHVAENMRNKEHPAAAPIYKAFAQFAEEYPEVAAQLADGHAQLAEKLQEHAQQFLEMCQ